MKKKILAIFIIIMITIPSYARVSVSDGSAFISKNEFSRSLNNLSTRLSIMENNMDAKIDSLVSTYLSRNGIWSGEKQTINTTAATWEYGFNKKGNYVARFFKNINASGIHHFSSQEQTIEDIALEVKTDYRGEIGAISGKTGQKIVDSITKTGLAIVESSCSDLVATNNQCYVGSVNRSINYFASDHFLFYYMARVKFYQESTNLLSSISAQFLGVQQGVYLTCPKLPTSYILMFVEKNKPLYADYEVTFLNDNGTDYSNTLVYRDNNDSYSKRTWKITAINIY